MPEKRKRKGTPLLPGPPETVGREQAAGARLRWETGAESVLTHGHHARDLPAETVRWSTITQIYEGTNQIQRMVIARQLLKG